MVFICALQAKSVYDISLSGQINKIPSTSLRFRVAWKPRHCLEHFHINRFYNDTLANRATNMRQVIFLIIEICQRQSPDKALYTSFLESRVFQKV